MKYGAHYTKDRDIKSPLERGFRPARRTKHALAGGGV